jgi:hypothetical protein
MHGNRDSIMKPDAAVWRYRRLAGGAGLIPDGANLYGAISVAVGARFIFSS